MMREFGRVAASYESLGTEVVTIDPEPLGEDRDYRFNLMYCRDLFFMTPGGAVMAAMANHTRREEPSYAARTLARHGVPILHTVSGDGSFEGADALWLDPGRVIVGIGNRTNRSGFDQLRRVLANQGVETVSLPSTQTKTQHLLGSLQIVDRQLALVRSEIIDHAVIQFLRGNGFTVVNVPENDEVRERQAMNIVTIAPRTVIMTARCPATRSILERAGITVAAELEISQLINGAGGLACATGILARQRAFQ
jgi:N-dimethylarginine dimethylaminohydrolase